MAMAAVMQDEQWRPHPSPTPSYSPPASPLSSYPHFSPKRTTTTTSSSSSSFPFDAGPTTPFLRFQRSFLLLVSVTSVMEGLGSVFGGAGVRRLRDREGADGDEAGAATALFLGSFSGIVSDIRGPRKACMLFCILHLLVRVLKCMSKHPSMWITNICLALASVFLFCFKTWMVTEHEKQGHRQDLLNETFWLMTFFESASLFGSQGLTNWLVKDLQKGFLSPAVVAALMAMISIPYIRKGWKGDQHKSAIENYRKSFAGHILKEKKDWLLAWAQTSTYISLSVFWVLWAPTIVFQEYCGVVSSWSLTTALRSWYRGKRMPFADYLGIFTLIPKVSFGGYSALLVKKNILAYCKI